MIHNPLLTYWLGWLSCLAFVQLAGRIADRRAARKMSPTTGLMELTNAGQRADMVVIDEEYHFTNPRGL